ncbi:glycerate kinase [candidate division KSB1 bacterium]|nr:glycerate kinase [candidate division KSB1 bacterium]
MLSPQQKKLRQHAKEIFWAGVAAVDPAAAVQRALQRDGDLLTVADEVLDLRDFRRVLVLGAGKASVAMAAGVEACLGEMIDDGLVVTNCRDNATLSRNCGIRVLEAGHPIPDLRGEHAAKQILQMAAASQHDDLIICLISGGGSALLPLPAGDLKLAEEQLVTNLLLSHGVTILEVNTVRKHLSRIKGGQLARAAHPARLVTLILSDVIGDPVDIIASGPTVPDPSTFADAERILVLYGIWQKLPKSVQEYITEGCNGYIPDTPKPDDPVFERSHYSIVGCNADALSACEHYARSLGYHCMVLTNRVQGEARDIGRFYAALLHNVVNSEQPIRTPACILAGGETTVTVRNPGGKGGRNQELALSAALDIDGLDNCVLLSAGTDGLDGPTEAAGAFADGWTVARARMHGMRFMSSFLRDNDSNAFFERLGDLFVTGPTGTNVMDLHIMLVGE